MYFFKNKKIINISRESFTTSLIIKEFKYHILKSQSDLYIIALGTNDVRYRDPNICAMNKKDYIDNIKVIVDFSKKYNKNNPKFIFISPWPSISEDKLSKLKEKDKNKMLEEYGEELKQYCKKNNYLYINPSKFINRYIKKDRKKYLIDQIHPNKEEGINLFTEAILFNSK